MSIKYRLKIGFVILTWNSEKVINNCLSSIFALRNVIPYVIVIDNGSVDYTSKILDHYTRQYSDSCLVIRLKKNMGTTLTRNIGIKKLLSHQNDYICIIDSDTVVNEEVFLKLSEEMLNHPRYGLIGPKLVSSNGVIQMSARSFPTLFEKIFKAVPISSLQKKGEALEVQKPPHNSLSSYPVDYLMSAFWLIRPDVFSKAGFLDEKIFYAPEDAEYCIRVWKSGYQVAYCPNASIIHEWQRLSKKKVISRINFEHIKGLGHMFIKHKYLISTRKIRKIRVIKKRDT